VLIRRESPDDVDAVAGLTTAAFGRPRGEVRVETRRLDAPRCSDAPAAALAARPNVNGAG
jgi:hypothetical protein